jgi:hypothetical protein
MLFAVGRAGASRARRSSLSSLRRKVVRYSIDLVGVV